MTDGTEFPLTGTCIYFVRPNTTKPVSTSNIMDVSEALLFIHFSTFSDLLQEVVSGVIDVSGGTSFLQAMWEHLSLILIPALRQSQKWGPVPQQRVNQFFHSLENYVEFLKSMLLISAHYLIMWRIPCEGAQKSINEAVYLTLETPVELGRLSTSDGCISHAKQLEVVTALEELVTKWCQQIEQVQCIYCSGICISHISST